ncbi:MAG TPA: recombination protein RecR, partial [Candidatus Limnocylindria bacterium]|nr:recombination protein RecR [Candidatus Limnocylindria bacterium]
MTRLVEQLARLPGIGEKTATRLAFYILRADRQYAQALAEAVLAVKD